MSESKVRFNLKNVHYAVRTVNGSTVTYGTPVAVPGAVSLSLAPQGDKTAFYADGGQYFVTYVNNGYEGDLEMAKFPDSMIKALWGVTEGTTSKVLTENASEQPKSFALLFEIDGDDDGDLYVAYNCVGSRPAITGATSTESIEVQTQASTITISPEIGGATIAKATAATPSTTRAGWFTTVFVEA